MEIYKPIDATGCPLAIGDLVRVIGVPDLSGMHPDAGSESLPVFRHIVGRYYRIAEFDEYGCAWLRFRIRAGRSKGWHAVAMEPYLLRKRRARTAQSADPGERD
jgi:hypothetical protein